MGPSGSGRDFLTSRPDAPAWTGSSSEMLRSQGLTPESPELAPDEDVADERGVYQDGVDPDEVRVRYKVFQPVVAEPAEPRSRHDRDGDDVHEQHEAQHVPARDDPARHAAPAEPPA